MSIVMSEVVTVEQKILSYMDTFVCNSGRNLAKKVITDMVKKDFVEEKMRKLRASSSYERSAAAYYKKHGTVGEF